MVVNKVLLETMGLAIDRDKLSDFGDSLMMMFYDKAESRLVQVLKLVIERGG